MSDETPQDPAPTARETLIQRTRWLDQASLKALAHPLRVQLMEALLGEGPATASALARRLGETSGATSYHLRQLERHGFVADDPDRGTGRERWWRSAVEGISIRGFEFMQNPETRDDASLLLREVQRGRQARLDRWMAEGATWPEEWRESSGESEFRATMTPDELWALTRELHEVIQRHEEGAKARDPEPGETLVTIQLALFPIRRPEDRDEGQDQAQGEDEGGGDRADA